MRILALSTVAALFSATAVMAAPASVQVHIGPALQAKAVKTYGVRDVNDLADTLRKSVERELNRSGAFDGARIDLTLVDAVPNRPTFKQMSDRVGLSFLSFGVGGAAVEGQAIAPDGTVTPLAYKWYENDIRWAPFSATWTDAETTIQRFARNLSRPQKLASR